MQKAGGLLGDVPLFDKVFLGRILKNRTHGDVPVSVIGEAHFINVNILSYAIKLLGADPFKAF